MLTIPKEKLPIHIACIMDGKTREFYHSKKYRVTPIVDRVGGGDSFAAVGRTAVICRGRQATGRERIRWSAVRTSA